MSQVPESFLLGAGGGYRPPVVPDSFYDYQQRTAPVSPGPAARPTPAAPAPPLLSVSYPNRCTLSKGLLAALPHVRYGGRVLVQPPIQPQGRWLLYTRIPADAGSQIPARAPALFRTHPFARWHFMRPEPTGPPPTSARRHLATIGNRNVFFSRLHFLLGPEVPGHAGCYELLPQRPAQGSPVRAGRPKSLPIGAPDSDIAGAGN